jgi:hypothetical protein
MALEAQDIEPGKNDHGTTGGDYISQLAADQHREQIDNHQTRGTAAIAFPGAAADAVASVARGVGGQLSDFPQFELVDDQKADTSKKAGNDAGDPHRCPVDDPRGDGSLPRQGFEPIPLGMTMEQH